MARGSQDLLRFLRRAGTVGTVLAALAACTPPADLPPGRVPRFVASTGSRPHLALVLGSGGPRGFAHVGVLKVLEENGIHPDLIVGSSVGAMVGAIYASGMKAAELEKVALGLNLTPQFSVLDAFKNEERLDSDFLASLRERGLYVPHQRPGLHPRDQVPVRVLDDVGHP